MHWISLVDRKIDPELLDHASDDDAVESLRDLERINRFLGGHRVIRWAFRRLKRPAKFSVLDVGAASGDNGRAIRSAWPDATVTSLDLAIRNLATADAPRVVGDAFRLPIGAGTVDYVFCSLFLHHFSDDAVVTLLEGFAQVARRGVVVTDLERHALAYRFLAATRWLFGWHPVTLHDGPVSVRAGFTAAEFRDLAARAGLVRARVDRHLPWFRLSIVWER